MARHRISDRRLVPDAIRARLVIPAEPEFDRADLDLRDAELRGGEVTARLSAGTVHNECAPCGLPFFTLETKR